MDRFITELQGKVLPFQYKGMPHQVQVAVRPIQFWEIVFPEEHRDLMCTTLLGNLKEGGGHIKPWILKWIRRVLRLEEIPDYNQESTMLIAKQDLDIVGVGIKKDKYDEHGEYL